MKRVLLLCLLIVSLETLGQSFRTITIGDATNDYDGTDEFVGASGGRFGHITWDANNLYVGVTGNPIVNTGSNFYIVIDTDPVLNNDPRSGNGRSNQPTTDGGGATYPFNADVVYQFFGTGSDDGSIQNPASGFKYTVSAGTWTSTGIPTGVRCYRRGGTITDFEIPFSDIGLSANANFNVLFYVANSLGGIVFAQWPNTNPISSNPTMKDFYAYRLQSGVTPNDGINLSYRETSGGYTIGASTLGRIYFVPSTSQTYFCGSLTSSKSIYVGPNATFSMGSNAAALDIQEELVIGTSGTFNLSTAIGGDLGLGGNYTNNGTLNTNSRLITFFGSGTKTIATGGTGSGRSFAFVTFNGAGATWQLSGNGMQVNNTLTFTDGKLDLNGNNLVMGASSSISGGSATSHVITSNGTNTGFVTRTLGSGASFTFPVGTSSHYLPVTLQDAATSSHDFAVRAYTPPTSDGVPGSGNSFFSNELERMVQAIWNIDRSSGTGNVNVTLSWPAALEGATFSGLANGNIGISRRGAGGWLNSIQNSADNTTNTATATFSQFSPFGVGQLGLPLPVKFTAISGQLEGERARITWTVAEEFNVERYELEESADGISFRTLLTVSAGTGTRYQGMDPLLVSGNNYYRVKAVDIDGKLTYSRIIRLVKGGGTPGIQLSPVPAREQVNLLMTSLRAGTWNLTIVNAAGQVVLRQSLAHDGSNRNQPLALPAGLSRGLYWLQLGNGQESYRQSLLVE